VSGLDSQDDVQVSEVKVQDDVQVSEVKVPEVKTDTDDVQAQEEVGGDLGNRAAGDEEDEKEAESSVQQGKETQEGNDAEEQMSVSEDTPIDVGSSFDGAAATAAAAAATAAAVAAADAAADAADADDAADAAAAAATGLPTKQQQEVETGGAATQNSSSSQMQSENQQQQQNQQQSGAAAVKVSEEYARNQVRYRRVTSGLRMMYCHNIGHKICLESDNPDEHHIFEYIDFAELNSTLHADEDDDTCKRQYKEREGEDDLAARAGAYLKNENKLTLNGKEKEGIRAKIEKEGTLAGVVCYTEIIGCWKERKETTVRAWKDESSNWDQAIVFYDSLHTPVNQWKKLDKNSKVVLHGKVENKKKSRKTTNWNLSYTFKFMFPEVEDQTRNYYEKVIDFSEMNGNFGQDKWNIAENPYTYRLWFEFNKRFKHLRNFKAVTVKKIEKENLTP